MSSALMLTLALSVGPAPTNDKAKCDSKDATAKSDDGFKLIHVNDLVSMEADAAHPVHIYDANGDDTRKKEGIIPGAVLLSSFKDYDVSTLPKDKASALVFYCGNTKCMASHAAAKRANQAGYANVAVMADGIMGWKQAGQAVAKAQ
jgi:rhodanese-related sulfurtransferase